MLDDSSSPSSACVATEHHPNKPIRLHESTDALLRSLLCQLPQTGDDLPSLGDTTCTGRLCSAHQHPRPHNTSTAIQVHALCWMLQLYLCQEPTCSTSSCLLYSSASDDNKSTPTAATVSRTTHNQAATASITPLVNCKLQPASMLPTAKLFSQCTSHLSTCTFV